MLRGEIWTAVWPSDPKQKERPVLVVSNNIRNQNARFLDLVVVKITSAERTDGTKKLINPAEDVITTLKKQSLIRCGSIYAIEKVTLKRKLQQLTSAQMADVDAKLKVVLDLN
jgi:mRNA-degrading endonuclease toxin of MazEF toxin-antitoxin module